MGGIGIDLGTLPTIEAGEGACTGGQSRWLSMWVFPLATPPGVEARDERTHLADRIHDRHPAQVGGELVVAAGEVGIPHRWALSGRDRKSTRLNSSHVRISYAVFCLKKKKKKKKHIKECTSSKSKCK